MIYTEKQKIRVYNNQGKLVPAIVLSKCDFVGSELYYWVQYEENGIVDVSLFTESKLDEMNKQGPCTCGALKTRQPSCSFWCDSLSIPA